tara:strand:+ start:183 stop:683 length:501 start_codon:yes stop_codon:yes gene_type:complete
MSNKGFTLIELLVAVAIIGILASVGIVAFRGYIESAKINTTTNQHVKIVDFIKLSITDCKLSGGGLLALKDYHGEDVNFDCLESDAGHWRNAFYNHFMGLNWKNAYGEPDPHNNRDFPACCMPYNDNPYRWITGITSIGTTGVNLVVYTDVDGVVENRLMDIISPR